MSEMDQEQIIGRLSIERGAARRKAEVVRHELTQAVNALDALLTDLKPRTTAVNRNVKFPDVQPYAQKYTDLNKLLDLVREQEELERKIQTLTAELASMGA